MSDLTLREKAILTVQDTVISLDCEANGLHGMIFAAAATVYRNGVEVCHWQERCRLHPGNKPVDPWVAANVLPAIETMRVTVRYYDKILVRWREFYGAYPEALVVAHVPWPVEARFLWDAHKAVPFSGPFPLLDVASMLAARGFDPTSVDGYLRDHGLPLPDGSPHHPLYDCRAAATAYFHLIGADRA